MARRGRRGKRRQRRFPWGPVLVSAAVFVVLAAGVGYLVMSWLSTYHEAQTVQAQVTALRDAVAERKWTTVTSEMPAVAASARQLASDTQAVPWQLLSALPGVGPTAGAARIMAESTARVATAAEPLAPVAGRIVEGDLRGPDGSIDVDLLAQAAPLIANLSTALTASAERLSAIDPSSVRPELAGPLKQVTDAAVEAAPPVARAVGIASLIPGMLGADGPRDWLVLLQNPAESRGSGGFVGGYAILHADRGNLTLASTGTSSDLASTPIPSSGAPEDAKALWGGLLTAWNTYNLSPNFRMIGGLSAAGMKARGTPVSGVIAVDPATVGAILSVVGPVSAGGYTLTADNVNQFFSHDIYLQIQDDATRDQVSMELVQATFQALITQNPNPLALMDALRGAGTDGGLRMWSAVPDEQAWLETTAVSGVLPEAPGPVVAVAFNNAAGSKTDAFVQTSVDYSPGRCATEPRVSSSITVMVRNNAPANLPADSVYGRKDDPSAPVGSTNVLVHIYAPLAAEFGSGTIDGVEAPIYLGTEDKRNVWWTYLPVNIGQERSITINFTEPSVLGAQPEVVKQSMVLDEQVAVTPVDACRSTQ